jgi:hypothetical protein
MNNDLYFRAITDELNSQKDRLQNFIRHWLTVGEFRETILRNVLRRHLPRSIGVARGFIINEDTQSTQIDILFYDTSRPVLFQEGELLILTPDAALGAIEVKKSVTIPELQEALVKLSDIAEMTVHNPNPMFFGLIAYEGHPSRDHTLSTLQTAVAHSDRRIINCLSVGDSFFSRYWYLNPDGSFNRPYNQWHSYDLQGKAPAYFVMNVVEHLCRHSVAAFDQLWFPSGGKEPFKTGEIGL